MTGDCHVRFCEGLGVRFPRATRPFKLAEAATLIEATRLLCYQALKLRDENLPHTKEVAMAKWYGGTCVSRSIQELLLLFGWRGYSEKLPVEQRLRDVIAYG